MLSSLLLINNKNADSLNSFSTLILTNLIINVALFTYLKQIIHEDIFFCFLGPFFFLSCFTFIVAVVMLYYYNGEYHSLMLFSVLSVSFSTCVFHLWATFPHKASHVCSFCPQRRRHWCAPVHFFTVLQPHLAKMCSFCMLTSERRKNETLMGNCGNKAQVLWKKISNDQKCPLCCASLHYVWTVTHFSFQ